jgi:hypothetical protein
MTIESPPEARRSIMPNETLSGEQYCRRVEAFPAFERVYSLTYIQLADDYGLAWLKLANFSRQSLLLSLSITLLAVSAGDALAMIVPRLESGTLLRSGPSPARKYRLLDPSLLTGIVGSALFLAALILAMQNDTVCGQYLPSANPSDLPIKAALAH